MTIRVKIEHCGPKGTRGFKGDKDIAKSRCRKLRRRVGKAEIQKALQGEE
jgi:hypothetical protein